MGRKKSMKPNEASKANSSLQELTDCYEGERFSALLKKLEREIESGKLLRGALPEKLWFKQQFSIGVNEVTRVLERMPCVEVGLSSKEPSIKCMHGKAPPIVLQAVLLVSDCNPRLLTKHLPGLASSRRVPLIFVRDKKAGSLRLGELVKLRTAIAIGVKARGSGINKVIEEVLSENKQNRGPAAAES